MNSYFTLWGILKLLLVLFSFSASVWVVYVYIKAVYDESKRQEKIEDEQMSPLCRL